ncbi:xylan 1,4-beta-xylosidase [Streptomyces sp. Ru73]|uniref:GH39 family glycosyl hydrolase n=1 Tax=Streptomyces sp. Ru73 TaxID=2080748 RepID=UPI000CDD4D74|nr:xylan 1,4-beta-xylosidase [Streptomyces sp. Ru73]POX36651.1 xylan 1,4-beta-xylosidase [Streptomyces sp. Ru73]
MQIRGRTWWVIAALLGTGVVVLALSLVLGGLLPGGQRGGGTGNGVLGGSAAMEQLGWGFTHTEYSADRGEPAAEVTADRLLTGDPMPQNQHIMGWGARSPEPSPGTYDFHDLDRRLALIRGTGGTPVLTLCCSPDWMKGGKAGKTDWGELEKAPDPDHYADFAKLAGKIAKRYPQVRHFVVWNELKGFFDEDRNRWDYEGYTRLYNLVYKELKKVDPAIQVGGPYLVMDSYRPGDDSYASGLSGSWGSVDQRVLDALSYWNAHKAGADFLAVDGSSYTRDNTYVPDPFEATRKFGDVTRWLRKETGLPVWWMEWYVEVADENDDRHGWSEPHRTAVQATAMMEMARAGVATALYWNPQNEDEDCPGCLWRSTQLDGGGKELPMMKLLARFGKEFPPGTDFRSVSVAPDDRPNVRVLADDEAVLVVNTLGRTIQARIDGRTFDMPAYGLRWLERR